MYSITKRASYTKLLRFCVIITLMTQSYDQQSLDTVTWLWQSQCHKQI